MMFCTRKRTEPQDIMRAIDTSPEIIETCRLSLRRINALNEVHWKLHLNRRTSEAEFNLIEERQSGERSIESNLGPASKRCRWSLPVEKSTKK